METDHSPLDPIFGFFSNHDRSSYEAVACQGHEPTEADIADFEEQIGFRLPDDFREFSMSPLGGLYLAVQESIWPRPKRFTAAPFWSFLSGITVFGIAEDIPEWLDVRFQWRQFNEAHGDDLVPFFQRISDPALYCFDPSGAIVEWDVTGETKHIDESFPDFLLRELCELEERKQMKIRGEDRLKK